MDKEKTRGSEEEIQATGESIIIAEAIGHVGDGLFEIAAAIREYARAMNGDEVIEDEQSETYLDGTRK